MNGLLKLGKYLYAIPFAVFGIMHLFNANAMAGMAPFGGAIIIYITGIALIAASLSIMIGKMDKLAAVLLGVMLILLPCWFMPVVWLMRQMKQQRAPPCPIC